MKEYIERDAVHDTVSKLKRLAWQSSTTSPNVEKCVAAELDAVHATVENIPTADVRPVVRGKWIRNERGNYNCSNCKSEHNAVFGFIFCPNCGADMRKANDGI